MADWLRSRATYANVMSTIAVFGVLAGGGAYAASKIGSGDIERNAVLSKHIKAGNVKTSDLAADGVTSGKLADDAVTFGKIANNAVGGIEISDGAIRGSEFFAQGEVSLNFPSINAGTCSVLTEQRQGTSAAHLLVTPPSHFADTFTLTGKVDSVSLGIVQYKLVACNVFGGGGAADPDSTGGTYRYLVVLPN